MLCTFPANLEVLLLPYVFLSTSTHMQMPKHSNSLSINYKTFSYHSKFTKDTAIIVKYHHGHWIAPGRAQAHKSTKVQGARPHFIVRFDLTAGPRSTKGLLCITSKLHVPKHCKSLSMNPETSFDRRNKY